MVKFMNWAQGIFTFNRWRGSSYVADAALRSSSCTSSSD
jgi:hypothetical protein